VHPGAVHRRRPIDRGQLDDPSHAIKIVHVIGHEPAYERAPVHAPGDQALADEDLGRLADRVARDVESLRERHLAQVRALREVPVDDRFAQSAGDLLGRALQLDVKTG